MKRISRTRTAALASGLAGMIATGLVPAEPASALPPDDGRADVYAVNTDDNGFVAVHGLDAANGFNSYTVQKRTPLEAPGADRAQWVYEFADFNGDRVTDLFAIDRDEEGQTAVAVLDGATDFQTFLAETTTVQHATTADVWTFDVADHNADGFADIFMFNRSDSGRTAVHILDGSNHFQSFTLHTLTALGASMDPVWQLEAADWNGDRRSDIYAINRNDSGKTAVHVLDAASNYQTFSLHKLSALGATTDPAWQLDAADHDGDGRSDVFSMYRSYGDRTTVHVMSAASQYQTFTVHTVSPLPALPAPAWEIGAGISGYGASAPALESFRGKAPFNGHFKQRVTRVLDDDPLEELLVYGIRARYRLVHGGDGSDELRAVSRYVPDLADSEVMIVEDWADDGRRVAVRWQVLTPTDGPPKGICIHKKGKAAEDGALWYCDLPDVPEGATIRWMVGSCDVSGTVTCMSYNNFTWTPGTDPHPNPEGAWMDYTDDADAYPGNGCFENRETDC